LQTMYDIPNRNLQTAQQIEQLQLRLQYLQQCSMNECGAPPQRPPEQQPVSVMHRGSQVQVNIKPDVPGHTLISVYHQYPTSTPPTPSNPPAESLTPKDCVPPEPIPSTMRASLEEPSVGSLVNSAIVELLFSAALWRGLQFEGMRSFCIIVELLFPAALWRGLQMRLSLGGDRIEEQSTSAEGGRVQKESHVTEHLKHVISRSCLCVCALSASLA
uniref:MITF_TFEB_C_3_N domain-containing protein n=1 Tax=Toxocara canis TaxID=6265 RepID=A0A183VG62_TOXCA